MSGKNGKTAPVAILVKQFPKLSETFIAGEIAELHRQGMQLQIFSMKRPGEVVVHPQSQELLPLVSYFDDIDVSDRKPIVDSILKSAELAKNLTRILDENEVTLDDLAALVVLIRQYGVRHLHAHYLSQPAVLADCAGRVNGTTFSVSAHAKDIYITPANQVLARLKSSQFIATCTRHNVDYLKGLSPRESHKIHLIYHGIDNQHFCPSERPPQTTSNSEPPVILSIGRFKFKKGFDLLIDACAQLRDKGRLFRCKIVGYGDQAEQLEQRISDLQLNDLVRLYPPVSQDEVKRLLQQAKVFVLPCRVASDGDRDGIPNSMLEAMACGLPVVSTTVSGIPEIVQSGENGLLVEPENVEALAAAMEQILSEPSLVKSLGQSARETVSEKFNWQDNVMPLTERIHVLARTQELAG